MKPVGSESARAPASDGAANFLDLTFAAVTLIANACLVCSVSKANRTDRTAQGDILHWTFATVLKCGGQGSLLRRSLYRNKGGQDT